MPTQAIVNAIKQILPWMIAAAILTYLFYLYPPSQIWEALQYVQLAYFIPFALVYFLVIYFTDIFSLSRFLKRFGFKIPLRSLFPARGVTYLIMILNYGAGQAGFAYYLKRAHQVPLWEAFSAFFFMMFVDLYWIITLAFVGSFFQDYAVGGIAMKEMIWSVAIIAYIIFAFNFLFWRGPLYSIFEKKDWRIIRWILNKDIFRLFKEARLSDYLKLALMRTPIHISLIISIYILLHIFGVSVPFLPVLGNIPLVILIGTIPITPGGLGTANAAMVQLLTPYLSGTLFEQGLVTPAEILLAASLLWMFTNYLLKAIFGVICWSRVSRSLFQSTNGEIRDPSLFQPNIPS